jgi:hypothetical protein
MVAQVEMVEEAVVVLAIVLSTLVDKLCSFKINVYMGMLDLVEIVEAIEGQMVLWV